MKKLIELEIGRFKVVKVKEHEQEQIRTIVFKLMFFTLKGGMGKNGKSDRFLLSIENFDVNAHLEQYKQLFRFTKAEAELTAYLSLGKTINQLSSQKSVLKHTLRTHLETVFLKTETHSKNELIVLLKNVV
jgi:DNA-binding CsgD family transcriptional regulator